ncbi:MAG: hydantoinase B/oxoprolinase family protein [Candidatus Dormibacteraceae bacterium]
MAETMADAVMVEVLRNHFMGIVRELGATLRNAARTVFVKETADFGAYLVDASGEVFMTPDDMGIFITIGTPMGDAIAAVPGYERGDVCITNDPESSGGMVTHLPDYFLWAPIFAPGAELPLCFAFCFIHATDVGGLVPGSVSPTAVDIHQEGLILPPSKLCRGGEMNLELERIVRANSRVPDLNWGDIQAQMGALEVTRKRMGELIDHYGLEPVERGIEGVLAYSERQARAIIERVPDGTYTFSDYMETDFREGPGLPIRIKLDLSVRGSEMELDFGATDPQVALALNLATHGKRGHNMIVPALVNYFRSCDPDITYNSGMVRPVSLKVPLGSLLNPEPGAALGARQATMFRVPEVIMGALAQAVPDQIPACGGGQGAIMFVAAPEFDSGTSRVSILQPLIGGSGARRDLDGTDGVDFVAGFYRNIPTEVLENDAPILIERYGLRQDGGGAGRQRGGLGLDYALRVLSPLATVTCRGMERMRFRPWGRAGGEAGTQGRAQMTRAGGEVERLGKIDVLQMRPGDVLELNTPCGAGYGPALERAPALVLADVLDGFVSVQAAEESYGVVVAGGGVDRDATSTRRRQLAAERPARPDFEVGTERREFERRWPSPLQDAVNAAAWGLPPGVRGVIRDLIREEVEGELEAGRAVAPESVPALLANLLARLRGRLFV